MKTREVRTMVMCAYCNNPNLVAKKTISIKDFRDSSKRERIRKSLRKDSLKEHLEVCVPRLKELSEERMRSLYE